MMILRALRATVRTVYADLAFLIVATAVFIASITLSLVRLLARISAGASILVGAAYLALWIGLHDAHAMGTFILCAEVAAVSLAVYVMTQYFAAKLFMWSEFRQPTRSNPMLYSATQERR